MIDRYVLKTQAHRDGTGDEVVVEPPWMEPGETAELLDLAETYPIRSVWAIRAPARIGDGAVELGVVSPFERKFPTPAELRAEAEAVNDRTRLAEALEANKDVREGLMEALGENENLRHQIAHLVAQQNGWEEAPTDGTAPRGRRASATSTTSPTSTG